MKGHDRATRERLITTATCLFAERGFSQVTVRDICRAAHANVAAVNYHFGSKFGLYREVLQAAISAMRETTESARKLGERCGPADRLRLFLRVHLRRLLAHGRSDAIHRLIFREMADPTPALDELVDQGMRPRIEYLASLVSELLGCPAEDPRVAPIVASIQGQWTAYAPNPLTARLGFKTRLSREDIDRIADHIADFSLGGIGSLKLEA